MIRFRQYQIPAIVGNCVRPLCFSDVGNEFYGLDMIEVDLDGNKKNISMMLGFQGSCTLIKFMGIYYAVFTRHQIARSKGKKAEDIKQDIQSVHVMIDDGKDSMSLPIKRALLGSEKNEDTEDFLIAEIETEMMTDFMKEQFLPVDGKLSGLVGDQALFAGFPFSKQQILMEKGGLRNELCCKTGVVTRRSVNSISRIEYMADGDDLNGLSGGIVLLVRLINPLLIEPEFYVFCDGIIQRGGNGRVYYLTMEKIIAQILLSKISYVMIPV